MSAARVLFIVYELPPLGGGVATAASHLLKSHSCLRIINYTLLADTDYDINSQNIKILQLKQEVKISNI